MALESQNVLTQEQRASVEFQRVFEAMDALRIGDITLEQYREIPEATRRAARQWRVDRANRMLSERYPDLSLESDI